MHSFSVFSHIKILSAVATNKSCVPQISPMCTCDKIWAKTSFVLGGTHPPFMDISPEIFLQKGLYNCVFCSKNT